MTKPDIESRFRALLTRDFPALAALQKDESIWDSGGIDSMGVITLVERIEKEFELRIPAAELTDETFASTGRIAAYLTSKITTDA